ncbi:MAG: PAS domain S-box protein, partial [Bacteroidetes bacterium]|nr:PAS domain S-box protein [Bacteroidota bacterium]
MNIQDKTKEELIIKLKELQQENDSLKALKEKLETELLKTRENKVENTDRFRSIIENTQAGYFFVDNDGLFQDVNTAWLKLYKYESKDEVIGKHFTQFQNIDDIENAKEVVKCIRKGNQNYTTNEFSRKCKDGSIGYHTFSAHSVYSKNEIIGIEGFIIDIANQKSAENELKKAKEKAQLNEARLIDAQSVAKVGNWETNLLTMEVLWSEETYKIFELDSEKFQNSHPSFLKYVHHDDIERIESAFAKSFSTTNYHSVQHRIITPSNKSKHVGDATTCRNTRKSSKRRSCTNSCRLANFCKCGNTG